MAYCNALIKKTGEKCKCKVPKKGDRCRHHPKNPKKKRRSARVNMTTNRPPIHEIIVPCDESGQNCGWYLLDEKITDIHLENEYKLPENFKLRLSNKPEDQVILKKKGNQFGGGIIYEFEMDYYVLNVMKKFGEMHKDELMSLSFDDETQNNNYGFWVDLGEDEFFMSKFFVKKLHLRSIQDRIMKNRKRIEDTVLKRTFSNTPFSDAITQYVDYGSFKKRARVQPRS